MIRGLIGVVHLAAMPGDPQNDGESFADVRKRALADAEALAHGGASALIVENFGSAPFFKERSEPHHLATIALVVERSRKSFGLPIGVNCLRNDAHAALGVAAATGAAFIRVNVHSGATVTDQGLIEGRAAETLRFRKRLGAEVVAVWADVLVKHGSPLADVRPASATRDCLERGLADAVIVTGQATGASVDRGLLGDVRGACGLRPLYLGSGVQPSNVAELAPLADGAIVGSWVKRDGVLSAPVDRVRVRQLVDLLTGCLNKRAG